MRFLTNAVALTLCGGGRFANAQANLTAMQIWFQRYWWKGELLPEWPPDFGFGSDVSIDSGTALVGSFNQGARNVSSWHFLEPIGGSAQVFVRPNATLARWQREAVLVFNDAGGPYQGYSTAISGDHAVVGLFAASDYTARAALFARTPGTANWDSGTLLDLHDEQGASTTIWDDYPPSVAIDGSTVLVGLRHAYDSVHAGSVGCVWVYVKSGGLWALQGILRPDDGVPNDMFGTSVSISGDTALIGAIQTGYDNAYGKAYVYTRSDTVWSHQQTLFPESADVLEYSAFGVAVSLDDEAAIVGNRGVYDSNSSTWVGAYANVYTRSADVWSLQAQLTADVPSQDFANSVSLKGDKALLGSPSEHYHSGAAYLYDRSGSSWTLTKKLEGDHINSWGMLLGMNVALDDDGTALVSAEGTYGAHDKEGSVFVYDDVTTFPPGPYEIMFQVGFYEPEWGLVPWSLRLIWKAGRGRAFDAEIFQNDCVSPIWDVALNPSVSEPWVTPLVWSYEEYSTYNFVEFFYGVDEALLPDSVIYNSDFWQLEVCHKMRLLDDDGVVQVEEVQLVNITYDPRGPGNVTGNAGDPHLVTFDGLHFDCQAEGEFLMAKSQDSSFQVQERFTAVSGSATCAQASVSIGVVIADGDDKPKIQLSIPTAAQAYSNNVEGYSWGDFACPVDFYVDEVATQFDFEGDSIGDKSMFFGANSDVRLDERGATTHLRIIHLDTMVTLDVEIQGSPTFGCHLFTQLYLPNDYRPGDETIGLLGTRNGDPSDDWVSSDGTPLPPPSSDAERLFETAYNYCSTNWCITDPADSLFTYGTGESFDGTSCAAVYVDNGIEQNVTNPPSYLAERCASLVGEGNAQCLIDGLCGDANDAERLYYALGTIAWNKAQFSSADLPQASSTDWEIIYNDDLLVDFGVNSGHELQMSYDITVLRAYEIFVFQNDCKTPVSSVTLTAIGRNPKDASHDTLVLAGNVDKANVAGSSIWFPDSNQLELCVVVQLVLDNPYMVLAEDKRVMTIDFDMSAEFNFTSNLGAGSIEKGSGSTNIDDYVQACKCGWPQSFTCDPSPLRPNKQLHTCVWSVEAEVEIVTIESMIVTQGDASMDVILGDQIQLASITSREYLPAKNGFVVSTRLPANVFSYGANGGPVTVSGSAELQLVGSGRKLRAGNIFDTDAPKVEEKARYEVKVNLLSDETNADGIMSSDATTSIAASFSGYAAVVGVVFALAWCI